MAAAGQVQKHFHQQLQADGLMFMVDVSAAAVWMPIYVARLPRGQTLMPPLVTLVMRMMRRFLLLPLPQTLCTSFAELLF